MGLHHIDICLRLSRCVRWFPLRHGRLPKVRASREKVTSRTHHRIFSSTSQWKPHQKILNRLEMHKPNVQKNREKLRWAGRFILHSVEMWSRVLKLYNLTSRLTSGENKRAKLGDQRLFSREAAGVKKKSVSDLNKTLQIYPHYDFLHA